jgi:hypothetical protein
MLFLAPIHVLIIYGAKRFFHTLERQEAVFEEIQRRAAKAPPGQRQAVIDALKKRYDQVEAEVALVKEHEEADRRSSHRKFWFFYWCAAAVSYGIFGGETTIWLVLGSWLCLGLRAAFSS